MDIPLLYPLLERRSQQNPSVGLPQIKLPFDPPSTEKTIATSIEASGMERSTTFNPPSAEKAIATVIVNQFDPSGLNFRPASRWKGDRDLA